jgi:transposase
MKGIVGDYAIRRQYAADGLTLTEAAAQLGITRSGLYQWARRAWGGVCGASVMPSVKLEGPRLTEEEVAARLSCYAAGMTLRQAAAHLGVTYAAMRHWARRSGLRFCRDFVGNYRLPAEEDAARRACAADGLTVSQAARKLGMSVSALSRWAHRAGVRYGRSEGRGLHAP